MTRGIEARWFSTLSVTMLIIGCTGSAGSNGGDASSGGAASAAGSAHSGGGTLVGGATSAQHAGGTTTTTGSGGASALGGATASSNTGATTTLGGAGALGGATATGGAGAHTNSGGNATGGKTTGVTDTTGGTTQTTGNTGGTPTSGGTTSTMTGAGGTTSTGTPATGGAVVSTGGAEPAGGATQTATIIGGSHATGGSSAGTGGTSAPACPTSADYVGDKSWPATAQVTDTAEYCGIGRETRTLEQELAAKAKLRIAAGVYPLPTQTGSYAFAWPMCFEFPPGTEAPKFSGAGQVTVKHSVYSTDEFYNYMQSQPLASSRWSNAIFFGDLSYSTTPGAGPTPLVLDGSAPEQLGSPQYALGICQSEDCTGAWDEVSFYSCGSNNDRLWRDTITFAGGQVVFELRVGRSNVSTEPSSFVFASGTLDGSTFTQSDYWKLIYRPEHHHFRRNYAVLFSDPIAGACGLKAEMVGDPEAIAVHTINCDLSNIAARAVTASSTEKT